MFDPKRPQLPEHPSNRPGGAAGAAGASNVGGAGGGGGAGTNPNMGGNLNSQSISSVYHQGMSAAGGYGGGYNQQSPYAVNNGPGLLGNQPVNMMGGVGAQLPHQFGHAMAANMGRMGAGWSAGGFAGPTDMSGFGSPGFVAPAQFQAGGGGMGGGFGHQGGYRGGRGGGFGGGYNRRGGG